MKKTFYLQKRSRSLVIVILVVLALGMWLTTIDVESPIYRHELTGLFFYLFEENYKPIALILVVLLPVAVIIGSWRLIVTDTHYIYQGLFNKQEFLKKEYRIVGKGSFKEETRHQDETSTEKWKQLDIIDRQKNTTLIIKAKINQKTYQQLLTFLKIDEHTQTSAKDCSGQISHGADVTYRPLGDQKLRTSWWGWIFTVVSAIILYIAMNHFTSPFLSAQTRWLILIIFVVASLWKIIDWRKKQPLTKVSVKAEALSINDCSYSDNEVILVELTSSEEDAMGNDYLLSLTHRKNGNRSKQHYGFKLKPSQLAEYQKVEQAFLSKYGPVGKYRVLMGETYKMK